VSLLEVRDLRVWFEEEGGPTARAVDGVDFEVGPGEAVGLVGESGCGKTVTALALMGLLPRSARVQPGSRVSFEDEELLGASAARHRELRGSAMAMVFQDPMTALNPVLPVGYQVVEGLRRRTGLARQAAKERGLELLHEVGITDPAQCYRQYPHQLSGGMSQRAMLAMAVSLEPRLLIADEPTTALDVTVQAQVLDLLDRLCSRRRMGMLLVTHDLAVVAQVCDHVVVMYAGQVVESGSVAEIFRRPRHPYTRGLLGALPRLDDRRARLRPIPGSVPPATAWPEGCRFSPRCKHAWERCREAPHVGQAGGENHTARCWLLEEPARDPTAAPATSDPKDEGASAPDGGSAS
jgi:oligopeptide/dipeptide ABC transporter ATP-binding protein